MSNDPNQSQGPNDQGTRQQTQQNQGGQGQQGQPAQGQQGPQGQQQQGQRAQGQQQQDTAEQVATWFTEKLVRVGAVLVGLALLLFALGQIAGVDLLSTVGSFLTSSIGAYVLIAFFALLIIVAATKDWNISNT